MLQVNQLLPDFTLDSSEGVPVRASQYRGKKNLVISLLSAVPNAAMEWLNAMAQRADDLADEDARVLIVVRDTPEQARELREELGAAFIILADCDGLVHRSFAADGLMVIITDRYGEIYSIDRDALPDAADVIASLRHINIMCDE
jgi:peroxiredoxin